MLKFIIAYNEIVKTKSIWVYTAFLLLISYLSSVKSWKLWLRCGMFTLHFYFRLLTFLVLSWKLWWRCGVFTLHFYFRLLTFLVLRVGSFRLLTYLSSVKRWQLRWRYGMFTVHFYFRLLTFLVLKVGSSGGGVACSQCISTLDYLPC